MGGFGESLGERKLVLDSNDPVSASLTCFSCSYKTFLVDIHWTFLWVLLDLLLAVFRERRDGKPLPSHHEFHEAIITAMSSSQDDGA